MSVRNCFTERERERERGGGEEESVRYMRLKLIIIK